MMKSGLVKFYGWVYCLSIGIASVCNGQDRKVSTVLISNIIYSTGDTLKADLYLPVKYAEQKNQVLIFIDGLGSDFRKWDHYKGWASFAASRGFIGVVYASRENHTKDAFKRLLDFLSANNGKYFIDTAKIAVYAGSGNVGQGLLFANEEKRVKAALIFYGAAKMEAFRPGMPVLLVRAGFDNVQLNKAIDTLAFKALAANAPYTINNFSTGVHGFEDFTGDTEERKLLELSLDFLERNMQEDVQKNLAANAPEVIAIRQLYQSNWRTAFEAYTQVLKNNPANNEAERQLGNICIEMKEYGKALMYFNNALAHGNWRKGEIAVKKIYAYAKLNQAEAAVAEMHLLKKIGWFKESDYTGKKEFNQIIQSASYKNFLNEK